MLRVSSKYFSKGVTWARKETWQGGCLEQRGPARSVVKAVSSFGIGVSYLAKA